MRLSGQAKAALRRRIGALNQVRVPLIRKRIKAGLSAAEAKQLETVTGEVDRLVAKLTAEHRA